MVETQPTGSPAEALPPAVSQAEALFKIDHLKIPGLVALTGVILGLIGDLLFYKRPPGISVPIFVIAVVLAVFGLAVVERARLSASAVLLAASSILLACFFAIRAAPLLQFMNAVGALLLFGMFVDRLQDGKLFHLDMGRYATALLSSGVWAAVAAIPLLIRAQSEGRKDQRGRVIARRVAVGLVIAIPFLCVFTGLLASADLVFNRLVSDLLERFNLADLVGHVLVTGILGWLSIGLLAYALRQPREAAMGKPAEEDERKPRHMLGVIEASVPLISIDLLFLVFVIIQAAALFGGEAFLRSQGLTYSEYARRGFFELVAVAVIALSLLLGLDFVTFRGSSRSRAIFLGGVTVMISLTLVMLVSAFMRMALYEQAYGFTRLRLHTHVFMVWLAQPLISFVVLLVSRRVRSFATVLVVFALGYTLTLNLLNPDAFIARQNLRRYAAGEELDVAYLGSLSEDAMPVLMPLLTDYGAEIADQTGPWLRQHLSRLDRRAEGAGWMSYHWSYNTAYSLLNSQRSVIEEYDFPTWDVYSNPDADLYNGSR